MSHKTTAGVLRVTNLHSLLLEAHELLPDINESLGEVWDVLDPLHQLTDHLQMPRNNE